jgi:hypothetical protein
MTTAEHEQLAVDDCACTWGDSYRSDRDHDGDLWREFHDQMLEMNGPHPLRALAEAIETYSCYEISQREGFHSFVAQHNWTDPVGMAMLARGLDDLFTTFSDSERLRRVASGDLEQRWLKPELVELVDRLRVPA